MVVISAAILNKNKTLLARQFVEISKLRVEGLLSAFSKLLDSGGKDHTYIETESVRYVYQPIESLYLLLITNKQSNILEDLSTLRLISNIVQDSCQVTVNEESVCKHAFDIVFALDEVISFGYRESVTLAQIKTYCEMDSHEEMISNLIEQNKIGDAKEKAKRKQMELAKQRAMMQKAEGGGPGKGALAALTSFSGSAKQSVPDTPSIPVPESVDKRDPSPVHEPSPINVKAPTKGLKLGKAKATDSTLDALRTEVGKIGGGAAAAGAVEEEVVETTRVNPLQEPVCVTIEEKLIAKLSSEGGVEEVTVEGALEVKVLDVNKAGLAAFKITPEDKRFKYKVHPNLNKQSYANGVLEVRDTSRAFRPNTPAALLKYKSTGSDESLLPISFNCWPSPTSDGTEVVLEFEVLKKDVTVSDVCISIPCPTKVPPMITDPDFGSAEYTGGAIIWRLDSIGGTVGSGSFEFKAKTDASSLMPIRVEGRTQKLVCALKILECHHMETGDAINCAIDEKASVEYSLGDG
uniref:Coatomer subunit delta n=1 Tax=Chromera velia CCMP2878 TaxID=1169474 RepID=A0A0G4HZL6_9ALVE|eukprot:Cvel_9753.t1-p1 / transcript=Cvel_9753.t1 / gene=Cvel_9753 / organism=Chromera_velia_CCMP2878 / gene_product=Coatomer subunit delta, putative / transcript_product=Coatomer subunit delta, putative / location=Cvel_scaffold570:75308-76867(-) / protein_length=520 / sequence_SO=supercontig / SO=protein_coding / is_pseudo=false